MLRIGKLTDYAARVMCALANSQSQVTSAHDLAQRTQLESPTVSKLLKTLAKGTLITSQRGVNGGYRLARPAEAISLADIVIAMEGPIGITECSVSIGSCNHEGHCAVSAPWRSVSQIVENALRGVTLAELVAPLQGAGGRRSSIPITLVGSSEASRPIQAGK